jgi:hypothetical protein
VESYSGSGEVAFVKHMYDQLRCVQLQFQRKIGTDAIFFVEHK